jgi:peptidoglycan L-alanyl-D-glutamate endopeptidase CwlK
MPKFSNSSKQKLSTCHSDLQKLFNEVIKHFDCKVLCGIRTEQEQQEAFLNGFSKVQYPNSYHNKRPSRAVDVVPYFSKKPHIRWDDIEAFHRFAGFVQGIASQMDIELIWGGDFKTIFDGPHFQLKG